MMVIYVYNAVVRVLLFVQPFTVGNILDMLWYDMAWNWTIHMRRMSKQSMQLFLANKMVLPKNKLYNEFNVISPRTCVFFSVEMCILYRMRAQNERRDGFYMYAVVLYMWVPSNVGNEMAK